MLLMRYLDQEVKYKIEYKKHSKNVVEIIGDIPVKTTGFTLSREEKHDNFDYSAFTTIYRKLEKSVLFSNDGSVYVAPPEPEPVPEPEPYMPTLEEVKATKKQEIETSYQTVKATGVDVEISTGTEHFPLTSEDVTFLMGKQFEMMSDTSEKIAYQDSENHCKFYSREDMQIIIQQALLFVNYQTTYRNNLCEWIDKCSTSEDVAAVSYGIEIPEEYRNEVYQSYLAQMEVSG